jgi:hypothetical protein
MNRLLPKIIVFILLILCFPTPKRNVSAQNGNASLYLSPANGTFEVGSTFDVSLLVNTGGIAINATKVEITFPADKLQVVDPHIGNSFVSIWITQPHYSNIDGILHFEGGLPNPGIETSAGLISTIKFRVKSPGTAYIALQDSCEVLANDGVGTNVLTSITGGQYSLLLPSPEGPFITSPSHPDKNKWYKDNNVQFNWELDKPIFENAQEYEVTYSWIFDHDPNGIPDNKAEGKETTMYKEAVEDGIWYFHVKTRVGDVWGKTGHYIVRIDTELPAEFTPTVLRQTRSADVRRVVQFTTTDRLSGVDHYEARVDSLTDDSNDITIFTEQTSPWILPELPVGDYEITVRAFDKAGNWREGVSGFSVVRDFLGITFRNGIGIGSLFISWWVIVLGITIIASMLFALRYILKRRSKMREKVISDILDKSKERVEKEKADYERVLKTAEDVKSFLRNKIDHNSEGQTETTPLGTNPHSVNFLKKDDGLTEKKQ